ncbi:MAG: ABC transporter ATP-binding protein [Planctomycetota bacterium]|jgi:ABC-type polysaccharide/polyol phosphate transport system ATPase subunit
MDAVVADRISKEYRLYPGSVARLKELFSLGRRTYHTKHLALNGVSFEVPEGRALGIIGQNGAGKSTLLKILAGTTLATHGKFEIRGSVSSLLELGAGFHTEFTGRANIYLSGQVQGFTRREIEERIDGIVDFAELGSYIDQPVRTYSSGMVMRLGFSIATAIDPEVLIIDEILAVGDLYFQKKCVDRIFDFRKRGKSILFCSHSLYDVRQICDEVIWIKDGAVEQRGLPQDVTLAYANFERSLESKPEMLTAGHVQATGENLPVIDEVRLLHETPQGAVPLPDTVKTGVDLVFEVDFRLRRPGHGVNVGAAIFRTDNVLAVTFNSQLEGVPSVHEEGAHRCRLSLPDVRLSEGEYTVVGYLFDEHGVHMYDHRQCERNLLISLDQNHPGLVRLHHTFAMEGRGDAAASADAGRVPDARRPPGRA